MQSAQHTSAMRRVAKRLILCIILGAVLQYLLAVAIALGGSSYTPDESRILYTPGGDNRCFLVVDESSSMGIDVFRGKFWGDVTKAHWKESIWYVQVDEQRVYLGPTVDRVSAPPPTWTRFSKLGRDPSYDHYPNPLAYSDCCDFTFGWPMRSASYFAASSSASGDLDILTGIVVSSTPFTSNVVPRVIPLRIHWPGAIANTLLYAAVIFMTVTFVPMARRTIRRRADRCTACGYDLRGTTHTVCPECGNE